VANVLLSNRFDLITYDEDGEIKNQVRFSRKELLDIFHPKNAALFVVKKDEEICVDKPTVEVRGDMLELKNIKVQFAIFPMGTEPCKVGEEIRYRGYKYIVESYRSTLEIEKNQWHFDSLVLTPTEER